MIGRWWHRRSNYSTWVGYAYPVLTSLVALAELFSPLSQFFMYAMPFGEKGSSWEWIMLAFALLVPLVMLLTLWRGRMRSGFSFPADTLPFAILGGFALLNLVLCAVGGFWSVLWLIGVATIAMGLLLWIIYRAGQRAPAPR